MSLHDPNVINYSAPPVLADFMAADEAFIRGVVGPFGSGKSSACVMKILMLASMQEPGPDGIRHSRWAAIRNSYRELKDTTIRTVEDWFPPSICTWSESNSSVFIRVNDIELEILFRALDTPEDVRKLLSMELTGAWVNEAKEVPKAVIDGLTGRVGRYPGDRMGGCTWSGIIMDTNPPDTDHWWYIEFEENKPDGWRVFHQPSGLAPNAENIEHLLKGARDPKTGYPIYYQRMMAGKTKDWIDIYVRGLYGFTRDGKPVYPEYNDELHTLKEDPPPPRKGTILTLGMDFGLTPAIVVCQQMPDKQWQAINEYVSDSIGATRFSAYVVTDLKRTYPDCQFRGWGDPAGTQRSQVDERTPYEVVHAAGLPIDPTHTNDFVLRREAVAATLGRLTITARPGLVVAPRCKMLRKAMAGAYCYKRLQVGGNTDKFRDAPDKNIFSHVAEALQYAMVGEGEDRRALDGGDSPIGGHRKPKVKMAVPQSRRRR